MKVVIARMNHETNTFSPVPTPLSAFGPRGPTFGADALASAKANRMGMTAFIDLAEHAGCEIVTPVDATANPSGPVAAAAYDEMCRRILDAVSAGCDAILLDLHGAMVAENSADGEGDLLERVRRLAPRTPLAVALDLHANVSEKMVANADVMVSFKTYPHVDMYETGAHAGRILFAMLEGKVNPALGLARPPLLSHTLRSATAEGAMKEAVEAAKAAEREGFLAASVNAGFSLADVPAAGVSVVVVADGDRGLAQRRAHEIARGIWADRHGFVYRSESLAASLARAKSLAGGPGEGPVSLLDHGDNCMSGGTCDTMDVLAAALEAGFSGLVAGPICDPGAVAAMIAAGVGVEVTLPIGNKAPLDAIGAAKSPLVLTGVVRAITDGEYTITGPTYTGMRASMGRTAVLDAGAAQVVVSEQTHEPWDLGVFTSVGIDPRRARFLVLKSRMYCRPVFGPISRGLVECASVGVTSSDYELFSFANVRRPIYPLDPEVRWD